MSIQHSFYPETHVGGFSRIDGNIEFWSRISALVEPEFHVLDFGAGRGAHISADASRYRRELKILKGRVAHVAGVDVDPAVLENPYLDEARVMRMGEPLPYPDASFDLVIANWVLEHVDEAETVAAELARVTKPGGWIAAATANRWGYVAVAASLIANRAHAKVLERVQQDRAEHDVFPTRYKMNTRSALKKLFSGYGNVYTYTNSAEPSYHFNIKIIYRLAMITHKFLPQSLQTGLFLFVQKYNVQDVKNRSEGVRGL